MSSRSNAATSPPPPPLPRPRADVTQVVSSCNETLLLTSRGEVLVCRNVVAPTRIKGGKTMTCNPPNNIDSADVAKITNGNNIDEDVTNSPSSAATLVGCQCDDVKSRSERRQSRVVNNCERCDRPLMSSTIVLNGNNNNNYSHNSHNFGSRINNGGGRKTSNRDNNQYDCCNDDDYFTNVNNGNGDDRRYGGSYDDDVHDSSGRGKNNSNHAAPVLSSSSWPGMDRAVDVDDDEVVDELCDLIGISSSTTAMVAVVDEVMMWTRKGI